MNASWDEISGDHRYNTSTYKGTFIRNPCIWVAQCMLSCGVFARNDSLNVLRLSKLYFLSCMIMVTGLISGLSWHDNYIVELPVLLVEL